MQISWGSMIHLWILTDKCWGWYICSRRHWKVIQEPLMIRDANRQEDELRQDKRWKCLWHCVKWKCTSTRERSREMLSHHGELCLQLFDSILLHVYLGAQDAGLFCGLFSLPAQVPFLSLQHVLLFGQSLYRVLALL